MFFSFPIKIKIGHSLYMRRGTYKSLKTLSSRVSPVVGGMCRSVNTSTTEFYHSVYSLLRSESGSFPEKGPLLRDQRLDGCPRPRRDVGGDACDPSLHLCRNGLEQ